MSRRAPHRLAPRPLTLALERLRADLAPVTVLARVQACWEGAVGEAIASAARPTGCREGVLTVTCTSAVWAQELELMGPELARRLNERLGGSTVRSLRCRVG